MTDITIHKNGDGRFHDKNGGSYIRVDDAPGTVPDILPPNDSNAERAVLGAILIDGDAIVRVSSVLQPEDFYIARHAWIYEAMINLSKRNEPCNDMLMLARELEINDHLEEIGGECFITGLAVAGDISCTNADYYADIVVKLATQRRLIDAAGKIARLGYQRTNDVAGLVDKAEEIILQIAPGNKNGGPRHIKAGLDSYFDRLEYLSKNKNKLTGIPTGLVNLDKTLGGLQPTDMIILGGRPGMGKTAFCLHVALNAAKKWGKRIAIFSLEMGEEQLTQRLLAAEAGIDSQRLRMGQINDDEWPSIIQATGEISKMPIFIDDTPSISVMELRSHARRLYAERGIDLLIIDYLQLMACDSRPENRQQEVSFISRSVKGLAKELKIPILALSQLSRGVESRQDKRPMLSDLRESGSLEQDADIVMFMYRDDEYNKESQFPNIAEIIVAKHRNGPTGVFSAYFKKHVNQFADLEVRRQEFEPINKSEKKPDSLNDIIKRHKGFTA